MSPQWIARWIVRHLQFDVRCSSGLFSHSTVNLLDFKGKLFGLVFNVSCLLRSLQFDPLFPITHPHTITLLHALLYYYVHCLSHVRSHDGRYYSECDTIMMSLLIMNNELEPHTLRVYDPEDHFS